MFSIIIACFFSKRNTRTFLVLRVRLHSFVFWEFDLKPFSVVLVARGGSYLNARVQISRLDSSLDLSTQKTKIFD